MEVGDNDSKDSNKTILYERERRLKGYPCLVETLEDLCLHSINKHSDLFLHFEESTGLNPFDCLPNSLKTKLLGNCHWRWGDWQHLLLNRHVSALEIHLDYDEDAGAVINFCASLAIKQPQLEQFSWSHGRGPMFESLEAQALVVSFPNFANLESLELDYHHGCNDLHLSMIATYLIKLRYLKLYLTKFVTSEGISALSTLEHLRRFPYSTSSSKKGDMLYNLCLQHLPNLLEIGDIKVNVQTIDRYTGLGGHIEFQSLQTPVELGLEEMILTQEVGVIPEGITFPNLTTLCIWDTFGHKFQLDSRFSSVTDLALVEIGMHEFLRILKILGNQIRKLAILEGEDAVQLDSILHLCLNLKEFHLCSSPEKITCSNALDPEVDFKYLEELRVDLSYVGERDLSPGLLVQLLMAPNLRKIDLNCVDWSKKDAETIVNLVQQGQILQKLETFEYNNLCLEVSRIEFHLVLDSMVRYCPRFFRYGTYSDLPYG